MNKRAGPVLLLLLLALVAAPAAKASLIPPGTFFATPDALPVGCYGGSCPEGLVASIFDGSFSNGNISGTYDTVVLQDLSGAPSDGLCVGCLNFEIEVDINTASTDVIDYISSSGLTGMPGFTGFLTDVGYDTKFCGIDECGSGTAFLPGYVGRASADTVDFFMAPNGLVAGSGAITPGNSSVILEIETNATAYTKGTISFIDGGAAPVAGFVPTAVEPAITLLLPLTLLSGGLLRKKLFA